MKKIISLIILSVLLYSQEDTKNIFFETDEPLEKNQIQYPDYVISAGVGYLIHQGNDLLKTSYTDKPSLNIDVHKYFFQGTYLTLSTVFSKTTVKEGFITTGSQNTDYTYFSYYLGINYFSRNNVEFSKPWFFYLGFGSNEFIKNDGQFGRFSVQLKIGKVTDIKASGGNLSFSGAVLMHEGLGVFDDPYDYYAPQAEQVIYTTIKLSSSLTFNFGKR